MESLTVTILFEHAFDFSTLHTVGSQCNISPMRQLLRQRMAMAALCKVQARSKIGELNVLGQSMVDSSSGMIESGKHELTSPQKFQANSENPELDCKENRTCRLCKSKQKMMKRREKLKARSKNSSSSSEKEICSRGSLKNCTERHLNPIPVDCENLKAETGEEDTDFDEISFGHKTGEILDFFHEYSSCTPSESPQSRPKLQIYSLLNMKKLKSIKLSQFSKFSRFRSSISDTESPRSKLIEDIPHHTSNI